MTSVEQDPSNAEAEAHAIISSIHREREYGMFDPFRVRFYSFLERLPFGKVDNLSKDAAEDANEATEQSLPNEAPKEEEVTITSEDEDAEVTVTRVEEEAEVTITSDNEEDEADIAVEFEIRQKQTMKNTPMAASTPVYMEEITDPDACRENTVDPSNIPATNRNYNAKAWDGEIWKKSQEKMTIELLIRNSVIRNTLENQGVVIPSLPVRKTADGKGWIGDKIGKSNPDFQKDLDKICEEESMARLRELIRENAIDASSIKKMRDTYGVGKFRNMLSRVLFDSVYMDSVEAHILPEGEIAADLDSGTIKEKYPVLSFFFNLDDLDTVSYLSTANNWKIVKFEHDISVFTDKFTLACLQNCFISVILSEHIGTVLVVKLTPRNKNVRKVWETAFEQSKKIREEAQKENEPAPAPATAGSQPAKPKKTRMKTNFEFHSCTDTNRGVQEEKATVTKRLKFDRVSLMDAIEGKDGAIIIPHHSDHPDDQDELPLPVNRAMAEHMEELGKILDHTIEMERGTGASLPPLESPVPDPPEDKVELSLPVDSSVSEHVDQLEPVVERFIARERATPTSPSPSESPLVN